MWEIILTKVLALSGLIAIFYLICLTMGLSNQNKSLSTFKAGFIEFRNVVLFTALLMGLGGLALATMFTVVYLITVLLGIN